MVERPPLLGTARPRSAEVQFSQDPTLVGASGEEGQGTWGSGNIYLLSYRGRPLSIDLLIHLGAAIKDFKIHHEVPLLIGQANLDIVSGSNPRVILKPPIRIPTIGLVCKPRLPVLTGPI